MSYDPVRGAKGQVRKNSANRARTSASSKVLKREWEILVSYDPARGAGGQVSLTYNLNALVRPATRTTGSSSF